MSCEHKLSPDGTHDFADGVCVYCKCPDGTDTPQPAYCTCTDVTASGFTINPKCHIHGITQQPAPELQEYVKERLSPWCKCICREAPDGTLCELCGHSHAAPAPELLREDEQYQPYRSDIISLNPAAMIVLLQSRLREARTNEGRLVQWKREATTVINDWEKVGDVVGARTTGRFGESVALIALEKVKKLVGALEKYGQHSPYCPSDSGQPCNCGLELAKSGGER